MDQKSKVDRIIEGLQILRKYSKGWDTAAAHDIFYGPGEASQVSAEDAAALDALGWHIDKDNDSYAIFT